VRYTPHVLAVQANQVVTPHSDPTLHNIHAVSKINPLQRRWSSRTEDLRFFGKPEIVKMKCDVHS
jgi:hypothetical protein